MQTMMKSSPTPVLTDGAINKCRKSNRSSLELGNTHKPAGAKPVRRGLQWQMPGIKTTPALEKRLPWPSYHSYKSSISPAHVSKILTALYADTPRPVPQEIGVRQGHVSVSNVDAPPFLARVAILNLGVANEKTRKVYLSVASERASEG